MGSRAALAAPAARAFGELHALLAAQLAGDDEAARLLNTPDWTAAMSRAAALKRRLECPAGLRAAVGLLDDEPTAGTPSDAADGGDGDEPAAFLRLAQRRVGDLLLAHAGAVPHALRESQEGGGLVAAAAVRRV